MENNNGKGIFYGVIGVATLIVAIIGATFAYFSASGAVSGDTITGQTADLNTALTAEVKKVVFTGATAGTNDLVPTNITAADAENISLALANKCEATTGAVGQTGKYTGCHVFKITIKSTSNLAQATLTLETLGVTGAVQDKTQWKYVVFKGTETGDVVSSATAINNAVATFDVPEPVVIHNTGLTANTPVDYYLMVFVSNIGEAQNIDNNKNVQGTYTGSIKFEAAGGQVKATFTA